MINASPYGLLQSAPPEWRPQEDRAASAFVGISFFLFLETIFEIFRVFKKRRGLYFWSLLIGVISLPVNNIAILLKYLVPGTTHIWPLYTTLALVTWSCYSLAQLLVLYSRLHLLVDNPRIQRGVLYLIVACAFFLVVPIWIVVWPAWNPDPELTERWSPADGIVERFTQLGFTLAEAIVSGIYLHSLYNLLRWKPTVRQRRVFLDLTYVSVVTIMLDILSTVLVYLNQTGTSHPIQIFSYALKFRLEFVILNQLMAVAARGIHRETFGEKRYHRDSHDTAAYGHQKYTSPEPVEERGELSSNNLSQGETEISLPAAVLDTVKSRSRSDQLSSDELPLPLQGRGSTAPNAANSSRARAIARAIRPGSRSAGDVGTTTAISRHRKSGYMMQDDDDDDDEDEFPVHLWERNGELVMRVPWLRGNGQRQV
ncbi:MAG: hypothetical protein Q9186_000851 [Xanthomendoza sp. 1 TL-2023]